MEYFTRRDGASIVNRMISFPAKILREAEQEATRRHCTLSEFVALAVKKAIINSTDTLEKNDPP